MHYAHLLKRRPTYIFILLALLLALVGCQEDDPGSPANESTEFAQASAWTNIAGEVVFLDPYSQNSVPIQVYSNSGREPLQNIRVEYLSTRSQLLIVVFDESSLFAPQIFEGDKTVQTTSGLLSYTHKDLQVPVQPILFFLDVKGKSEALFNILNLSLSDRPEIENWQWAYHEECWSHEQLGKALSIILEGASLIFPVKSSGGLFANETGLLIKAMQIISGQVIGEDVSTILANLPDPVLIRIAHVPTTLPMATLQVIGSCNEGSFEEDSGYSFSTLMTQQAGSFIVAATEPAMAIEGIEEQQNMPTLSAEQSSVSIPIGEEEVACNFSGNVGMCGGVIEKLSSKMVYAFVAEGGHYHQVDFKLHLVVENGRIEFEVRDAAEITTRGSGIGSEHNFAGHPQMYPDRFWWIVTPTDGTPTIRYELTYTIAHAPEWTPEPYNLLPKGEAPGFMIGGESVEAGPCFSPAFDEEQVICNREYLPEIIDETIIMIDVEEPLIDQSMQSPFFLSFGVREGLLKLTLVPLNCSSETVAAVVYPGTFESLRVDKECSELALLFQPINGKALDAFYYFFNE